MIDENDVQRLKGKIICTAAEEMRSYTFIFKIQR